MSGETKAFYMTLTSTVKAKTEEEYEKLDSTEKTNQTRFKDEMASDND